MRSLLIHTRSSYQPRADFISVPVTVAWPPAPAATALMMRPPSPRRIEVNRRIVPIDPV